MASYLEFEKPLVELEDRIRELRSVSESEATIEKQIQKLEERAEKLQRDIYEGLSIWQKVQLSRHPDRPYFLDYLALIFDDVVELHGDRAFADDPAIVAGFARFEGESVAVIGQQKGRTTKEKVHRNFGMAHPEGYRKACRIMELAARFRRPIFTFIDTPGAYPGLGAEERGQSEAIGRALLVMSRLRVPVIATVIGEGGSGGALGLGVANKVLMLQYATYSVITPEGCASILWRDGARASEAAEQLRLLAEDAVSLGVADTRVREPFGGAHRNPQATAKELKKALAGYLSSLRTKSEEELVAQRYDRFRSIGRFLEDSAGVSESSPR
ncbi:MAG: acetyl-CoA carboxylase carboxyltransferase subunit alpha [Myxococcota bacterium]